MTFILKMPSLYCTISHSEGFYYPENNIALTTKTRGMFYSFQQKMQKSKSIYFILGE